MSDQDQWDAEWKGLEPESEGSSRMRWAAFAALMVLICLGGVVVLGWQFLSRTVSPGPLPVPTSAETEPAAVNPTAETLPDVAATATLPVALVSSASAVQIVTAPTIDGELTDWPVGTAVESAFRVFNVDGWDGTDDVSAVWRLGWDATHLYVGVVVSDDVHVQTQTGNQVFRGDGLSMQIDTQRAQDLGPALSEDDFQIELSPGDFGALPPSAYRFRGTADNRMLDAPGARIVVGARPSANGYILEAAIPWVDLALQPQAGMVLGVALNVNDNDTVGTAVQEVMKSHVSTREFRNPASWGTLMLE